MYYICQTRYLTHLHQFGVMASVDNNSHNPLCIPELSATQQHLVRTERSWTEDNISNKSSFLSDKSSQIIQIVLFFLLMMNVNVFTKADWTFLFVFQILLLDETIKIYVLFCIIGQIKKQQHNIDDTIGAVDQYMIRKINICAVSGSYFWFSSRSVPVKSYKCLLGPSHSRRPEMLIKSSKVWKLAVSGRPWNDSNSKKFTSNQGQFAQRNAFTNKQDGKGESTK